MAGTKYGLITSIDGDMCNMIVFPRESGQTIASMTKEVDCDECLAQGEHALLNHWYELEFNKKGNIRLIKLAEEFPKLEVVSNQERLTYTFNFDKNTKSKKGSIYTIQAINVPAVMGPLLLGPVRDDFSKTSGEFQLLEESTAQNKNLSGISWMYVYEESEKLEEKFESMKVSEKAAEEKRTELAEIIVRILKDPETLSLLKNDDRDLYKRLVDLRDDYLESIED